MAFHTHVIRRGTVFHWKRRLPQSTGIGVLQVSLKTSTLSEACMIARRLSAVSDRMFDEIKTNHLSVEDARAWLRHVVSEELSRIRKSQTVIFADGGTDATADWAMREAWRMLATIGPNAYIDDAEFDRLQAEGRSEMEMDQLHGTLNMLGQDLRSEARMLRNARAFRELTSREGELSAQAKLHVRKLFAEGRAAAWAAAPADQGLDIANAIADDLAQDAVKQEREAFLGSSKADPSPALQADLASNGTLQRDCFNAPDAVEEPTYDPSIASVIERLIEHKEQEGVSSTTLHQYRSFASLFSRISGVSDVRHIRKAHVAQFRGVLQKLPKAWGKSRKDATATVSEMLARARTLPPESVGLSPGTINRHLDHLSQLLEFAGDEGIEVDEKVKPAKLRLKELTRDRDKRASFRKPELELLFTGSIWSGCLSSSRRNHPGDVVLRDGLYWIPILAAYTGARREELAGLTVQDIMVEDGIHFLQFDENENRGMKNFASKRRVPLHDRVIALGFLDHVKKMQRRGRDVFPELRPMQHSKANRSKKFGDRIWYAFDQALKNALDGNPRKLSLHSMRHYVRDQLALDTSVPEKVRYDLIGHELDDVDSRTYGEASPLRALHETVNKLPIVI